MAIISEVQKKVLTKAQLLNGSSLFSFQIPSIAIGGSYLLDLETQNNFPNLKSYIPLDFLQISNNAGVDFQLDINQMNNNVIYSKDGTINTFNNRPIRSIRITNLSTTTASTDKALILTLQKEAPNTDNISRKLLKLWGF